MAENDTIGFTKSRLLTNSVNFRDKLIPRNLYTPDVEYPLQNATSVDRIVGAINTVIAGITPFKTYNLKNTVIGRLITNPTPLTDVGLIMLGKQFVLNSMSHLAQQTFPVIKLSNLFDGNKDTHLFTLHKDFRITKRADETTFENFIDKIFYLYPSKDYPFNKDATNEDFIRNSGTGQLSFLYSAINRNLYKQNNQVLYDYAKEAKTQIDDRVNLSASKTYFDLNDKKFNPYLSVNPAESSINNANDAMFVAYTQTARNDNWKQEYAPTADFIYDNLGNTVKKDVDGKDKDLLGNADDISMNSWINNENEFSNDVLINKIVWGRDDTSKETDEALSQLRGVSEEEVMRNYQPQDLRSNFNTRIGLLAYTRNLLNATEGRVGDITRKAFVRGDKLVGFNGSGVWRAPSTALEEFAGRTGVRQHSALDQYDRFAKAIRFNGNHVYGGNPNSVIYNSVIPRVHPILNKNGEIDNKNLMFSIENLAVGTIKRDRYGVIDDEWGSPIPLCEVGPFNGRIMWFPPYNLEIVENANARFESTVMVGRNEPIYTYQNSERTGTITFTLLVDYPEQLKDFRGKNKQKEIAEFFEFGGNPYQIDDVTIENYELEAHRIEIEIEDIKGKTVIFEPKAPPTEVIKFVFPNDVPTVADNLNTIIDKIYNTYYYEIDGDCVSSDGTTWGLNEKSYFITGLTITTGGKHVLTTTTTQYNKTGITGQFGSQCLLNEQLKNIFGDENIRPYYSVYVYGAASKLYTELNPKDIPAGTAYNKALGQRRADAIIHLIKKRLEAMFGKTIADGIEVTTDRSGTIGDTEADPINATKKAIPLEDTKNERYSLITIRRNSIPVPPKPAQLSEPEWVILNIKIADLDNINDKINKLKNKANDCVMNERGSIESNGVGDTGILHGFQSITGNYYYPVFHSQTPEDFHRRLTFLHQCTRQGSAKKFTIASDDNQTMRARNSVFGRQPICILRIGDFFYTKIIIESVNFEYHDTTWDMNPEGFGMQPMIANITLNIKIMGGQSLKGPIDALQNAVSFNYYANSTFTDKGMYKRPTDAANNQEQYINGVLAVKKKDLTTKYETNAAMQALNLFNKSIII
jgi:hypothetical protein